MMARIEVSSTETSDGWMMNVTISDGGGETRHQVTLSREDYERLSGGAGSAAELVRASFEFLLEREPKESILHRFDLTVISRYFPEYSEEIRKRVGA
jgi:hypothetical protein